jgi:hypothetical protein
MKRGGFGSLVAAVLEAGGPLRVIGAQAAFLFNPLFSGRSGTLTTFGEILEDAEAYQDLIEALRDEGSG